MPISPLSSTQKYAAGALLALALRQAQIHQTHPLGLASSQLDDDDQIPDLCPHFWTHHSRALLRPVFRFLEVDDKAWPGLEETAASSVVKHHIGPYLRLIFEEDIEESSERSEQQLSLAKVVDAMAKSLEVASSSIGIKEKYHENEEGSSQTMTNSEASLVGREGELCSERCDAGDDQVSYQRKITVLYQLLSACVADTPQDNNKGSRNRNDDHSEFTDHDTEIMKLEIQNVTPLATFKKIKLQTFRNGDAGL